MNDWSVSALLALLHAHGYGVSINLWAEDSDAAVVAWLHGKPVASAHDTTLEQALARVMRLLEDDDVHRLPGI